MLELASDSAVPWNGTAPNGVTLGQVFFGPDPKGLGGFEVATAEAEGHLSTADLKALHKARLNGRDTSLVVAVTVGHHLMLCGPDATSEPLNVPVELGIRQLQASLDEADSLQATRRFLSLADAQNQTRMSGVRNRGLFATYHLRENTVKREDWDRFQESSQLIIHSRSQKLIEDLGFTVAEKANHALVLNDSTDNSRAVALLLDESESFDSESSRFHSSPVSWGLSVAAEKGVPWLIMLRREQIRLYPARDGIGVGQKGQTETYLELDLAALAEEYIGLLTLVFSAQALGENGTAQELLDESVRYATALGTRLRERIYDRVVPNLAKAVAVELEKTGMRLDAQGLQDAYRTTLRILFRLLFQAYAEDRGLLPAGRNSEFDKHSLTAFATALANSEPDFDDSTSLWDMLSDVWHAIDHGNEAWRVPAYNGGLFGSDPELRPYGALIKKISLPDTVMGPALHALLVDNTEDGVAGMVDFRSLSVREFGTIYEGLLESSLSVAAGDLTVDQSGAWVPAGDGDVIEARAGEPYFHNTSGERKASGSYFTPDFIVDYLVKNSIDPSLDDHLERVKQLINGGKQQEATRIFFDYRVADIAMGSGHFLVAAVDRIEFKMRSFLANPKNHIPGISNELERLAEVARKALGADLVAVDDIDEAVLLRRQIARRCIYGVDINPLAVELSRLAIWIHTFVPGLPMSTLDHNLVCANSLVGISSIDELSRALFRERAEGELDLQGFVLTSALEEAAEAIKEATSIGEATVAEILKSKEASDGAAVALNTVKPLFDLAIAVITGVVPQPEVFTLEELMETANQEALGDWISDTRPAHFPLLFPEVFSREKAGFDVVLGNPPWEELVVDTTAFWASKLPGLRAKKVQERDFLIMEMEATRPAEYAELRNRVDSLQALRKVLAAKFPIGGGDFDLFKAFAWQALAVVADSGGHVGYVLPKTAFTAAGLADWRRHVQSLGSIAELMILVNDRRWAFDMEPRYSIGLVGIKTGVKEDTVVRATAFSKEDFHRLREIDGVRVAHGSLLLFTNSASIPILRQQRDADVLGQMRLSPSLSDLSSGRVSPIREFDATTDRKFFDHGEAPDRIAVLTGASFNVWNHDTGDVFAWADPLVALPELERRFQRQKKLKTSAFFQVDQSKDLLGGLPYEHPRIAIRGVTNPTNTRTLIPALVPGNRLLVNSAPYLFVPKSEPRMEAYLLGVMSSIPFDWYARRFIETAINFHLLNAFPIPEMTNGEICFRIVELAGCLAAVNEDFRDWAGRVGVPVASFSGPEMRDNAIFELDALVAHSYGLTTNDLVHIFETFHRGWDYQPRLEKVLGFYEQWAGAK